MDVLKLVDAVVFDIADVPFANLGAYDVLVERLFSYPFILTVKELIVAPDGILPKLNPRRYKYRDDVDAYVFVIVAYVVLSVFVYMFDALDTDR